MAEQEGVIKYRLDYRVAAAQPVAGFAVLNAWRNVLWRLGLIGQDPARYGGLGYGNLSLRLADADEHSQDGFLVTGTQTGHLAQLGLEQYVRVWEARPEDNYLRAVGPISPSSEALTHAAVYGVSPEIRCVVHVHSPEIWLQAGALALATVAADVAYGTPEMADAVAAWVRSNPEQGVIAMLGHEDGLLAYGDTPAQACWLLTRCLADSLALSGKATG